MGSEVGLLTTQCGAARIYHCSRPMKMKRGESDALLANALARTNPPKRRKTNASGFPGVTKLPSGKFQGRLLNGNQQSVGTFASAEEAALKVQLAMRDGLQQRPTAVRAPRGTVCTLATHPHVSRVR